MLATTMTLAIAGQINGAMFALCDPIIASNFRRPDGKIITAGQHEWSITQPQAVTVATNAPLGLGPEVIGAWDAPRTWPVISIHSTLLPTGKVLQYAYPTNGGPGSNATAWDPVTDTFAQVDYSEDIFCSGHSHLADGRILVTGGNLYNCDFQGRRTARIFNPFDETWTDLEDMDNGRWYPTNITLPDGRVLITTGLNLTCGYNHTMEMFDPFAPAGQQISIIPEGERQIELYSRLHVLSDGRLARVGIENQAYTFDLDNGWQFVTVNKSGWRCSGSSVLIPGRTDEIMIVGGDCPLTTAVEIIDFKDANPSYRFSNPINHARAHLDLLILPDKTVLALGGGTDGLYGSPVMVPELFDPDDESWTEMAPHQWGRMYHSTTVLLPDGRVLVSGQDNGDGAFTAEIYHPPYLFKGARPSIDDTPARIVYGQTFQIDTPDAANIDDAVLIKLTSNTHSVNFAQRMVDMPYSVSVSGIDATGPLSPNVAPPGYYMLFIVNDNEVPSVAEMVRVGPACRADCAPDHGNGFRGNGYVNIDDLLGVVNAIATQDLGCDVSPVNPDGSVGNGVINIDDLLTVVGAFGECE